MENHHKTKILQNLTNLMKNIGNVESLIPHTIQSGLFTRAMVEDILARPTPSDRKTELILKVTKRGPQAFENFVKVLCDSGNLNAARLLVPHIDAPDGRAVNRQRYEETRLGNEPIQRVIILPAVQYDNGKTENEVYKMRSNPRGFALIFANTVFMDMNKYRTRLGCREDIRLLTELFTGLSYTVETHEGKSKPDVDRIIDEFVKKPELQGIDSCIVAVSSHGEIDGFVCADDNVYPVDRMISKFNNLNCPGLRTKPKVFFIQACRGGDTDYGIPLDRADSKSQSDEEPAAVEAPNISTNSDIIVFYATQPGLVAFCNPIHGSWLYHTMTRVFMRDAWKNHLKELMQTVTREVGSLKGNWEAEKQPMETVDKVWTHDMYFNPGLQ